MILGVLSLIVAVWTTGFVLIEGYFLFDAFYFTLSTITTIGYSEPKPPHHAGRAFNSVLIVFGVNTAGWGTLR